MSGYFKRLAQATFTGSTGKSGLASHFSRQAISAVTPASASGAVAVVPLPGQRLGKYSYFSPTDS